MSDVDHLTAVSLEVSSGRERLARGLRLLLEDVDCPRAKRRKPRPPDGLRTAAEAAAKLRCSIKTFNGHVAAGRLKYVLVGHGTKRQRRMFTDANLDEFISNQTRKDVPCPSTRTRARRTGSSISGGEVIAFSAQPRPRPGVKPKR